MARKMSLIVIAVFLISVGMTAGTVDVSGTWEMTRQTPRGERVSDMTIVQEGNEITVTMPGFGGEEMVGKGTVEENNISWEMTFETPRGEMTLTYKGTIDGDSMSGTVEMGDGGGPGPMEWTATKK